MTDILYTIFISPVEQIISLAYVFVFRVFDNPALSVLGVSFAVSILTLPLYFMAETLQRAERDIQKKMKSPVDNIKAVFSGDERFMRLAVYYRQNKYHPFYALRSSVSILIQIPFFIAAYHFLSNAEMLNNVSFGPIVDLAKPDSLFVINGTAINVLPVIMTLINCVSSAIYAKGFSAREKIQLYGMAGIFLILLYNSPSALVLYWTGNNIFSLVKNIIQKTKHPKTITFVFVSVICLFFVEYIAFFHNGWVVKRLFIAHFAALVPLSLYAAMFAAGKRQNTSAIKQCPRDEKSGSLFALSVLVLFLLGGLAVPSSLIRSSVAEFSFIENFESPFHFLAEVLFQSIGIFLVWPLCVYCIASVKMRKMLTVVCVVVVFIAMIDVFLFPGNYGFLTEVFTFRETVNHDRAAMFVNIFAVFGIMAIVLFLLKRYRIIVKSFLVISVCALALSSAVNGLGIYQEFQVLWLLSEKNKVSISEPVYQFSKSGKNVVVIMLDAAMGGYVPYIFEEKPELHDSFDGFTWYRNTVSLGGDTVLGSPGVFGGYEYSPHERQAIKDTPLVEKHNESLLLLPRIFSDHDFRVTVTDPPLPNYGPAQDLSIFDDYPDLNVKSLGGKYYNAWNAQDSNRVSLSNTAQVIEERLIRFSFFKIMPMLFRNFIYDGGNWLTTKKVYQGMLSGVTLKGYIDMDVLPLITGTNTERYNTYNALYNDITHDAAFLMAPDYFPRTTVTDVQHGPLPGDPYYDVNMAGMLLLGKWFRFLKENGVYDNTRIIIVADHGWAIDSKFRDNIVLPNGVRLQKLNPLLLVKDFNKHGSLAVDNSFMTNADVPIIALEDLVEDPVNPWTGKKLVSNKTDGVIVTSVHGNQRGGGSDYPGSTAFTIKPDEWMHVRDNIFDPKNWSMVKIE